MFEPREPRAPFAWGALLVALSCGQRLVRVVQTDVVTTDVLVQGAFAAVGLVLAWALWRMKPWALRAYAVAAALMLVALVGVGGARGAGWGLVVAAVLGPGVGLALPYVLEEGRCLELRARERAYARHGRFA